MFTLESKTPSKIHAQFSNTQIGLGPIFENGVRFSSIQGRPTACTPIYQIPISPMGQLNKVVLPAKIVSHASPLPKLTGRPWAL